MSANVPRRHAATTPTSVPKTIAKSVPSAIIGSEFLIGSTSSPRTGFSDGTDLPRSPRARIGEVEPVLHPLRLVEAEVAALRLLERLAALLAAQRRDGVAGEGAEEHEVESDRDEDGQDRVRDPLHDVVGPSHLSCCSRSSPVGHLAHDLVGCRVVELRVAAQLRVEARPVLRVGIDRQLVRRAACSRSCRR